MSDIIDDAQAWIDSVPERIGSHWTDCHTSRHHAPCLIRKLLAEVERMRTERLRLTDAEREAIEQAIGVIDWQKAYFSHLKQDEPLPSATLRKLLAHIA
jgi:hypothetical protein